MLDHSPDFFFAPPPLEYARESVFTTRNLILIALALFVGVVIGHAFLRVFG